MLSKLVVAVVFASIFAGNPAAANNTCAPQILAALGHCPIAGNDGSQIDITGTKTDPGTSNPSDGQGNPDTKPFAPLEKCTITSTSIEFCPASPAVNGVGEMPQVTLTDLAQFAPAPATLSAEPSNAGIADMPTNFLGAASVHTQSGSIFGFPVTVRFSPVGYDYTYGDGTNATVTAAGRSWEDLGQAQFTPTPTSHVYADRGTYTAGLSIRYSAEVDLGRGWYPVAGELTIPTAPQQIQIFEAHTALVAHTCTERPTAPGC
ncbi:hypothetical protein [Microbacterium natoriense]